MSDWNDQIISEFRANNGRVGGNFAGAHLVLLHTTGAKSGEPRVSPMMSFRDGDEVYVVASKAGAPENPAWFHNLVANPGVSVELATDHGIETWDGTALVVDEAEHARLWPIIVRKAPGFADYQTKTTRVIPIVRLVPSN